MNGAIGHRIQRVALATLVAAVVGVGCAHDPSSSEPEASGVARAPAAGDHPVRLMLDVEAAARAGIRTAIVARATGSADVEAFGRGLDPLPFVTARHARSAAHAALELARGEYARVSRLHRDDQNASTRDLENAQVALERATLDWRDADARLTVGWGPAAAEPDAFDDDLVAGRVALVRVDLPAGIALTPPPATVAVAGTAPPQLARVLGRSATTDPLVQGDAYLALIVDDPPRPGAVFGVTVPRQVTATVGVVVPAAAIVWFDAHPVAYAEPAEGEFERRTVTLGPRLGDRWIVTAGLAPDERVVVGGAARLLSTEIVGAAPASD
jgi:hypothetical protein